MWTARLFAPAAAALVARCGLHPDGLALRMMYRDAISMGTLHAAVVCRAGAAISIPRCRIA